VICADYGKTPWVGLASIVRVDQCSDSGGPHSAGTDSVIVRARARYNTYWDMPRVQGSQTLDPPGKGIAGDGKGDDSDLRGILAQEFGHCLGIGHSEHNCMGKGYFPTLPLIAGSSVPASNIVGPQNVADARSRIPPY
jgi:hypothetical protein